VRGDILQRGFLLDGFVKLFRKERESSDGCHQSLSLCSLWKTCSLTPCHKRLLPEHPIMGSSHPMSSTPKQIVQWTMSRKKSLRLARRFEASHLALSLPSRLM